MTTVVSIHSFRGGTGKSNTTANVAALLAAAGQRVAVVDTDIQSPGIHVLFGLEGTDGAGLNDFLWGTRTITDVAIDVTDRVAAHVPVAGSLHLVRASVQANEIARVLHEGYDVAVLQDGLRELVAALDLDVLMIDTHPGLNEETLLSIMVSDALLVLMRPDRQDFEGTAVTVGVARRLHIPELLLVVNKVPTGVDRADLAAQVAETYGTEPAGLLPFTEDVARNASVDLFALAEPAHPWSAEVRAVAARLTP